MVEMNHLLSKQECKVKSFHFEDVTVKTITSLKKITLVTPGPHGSQKKRLLFCCCYWQLSFVTQSTTPCWDVTLHCASEGAAWAGECCHCGAFTLVKGSSQNHFILEAKAWTPIMSHVPGGTSALHLAPACITPTVVTVLTASFPTSVRGLPNSKHTWESMAFKHSRFFTVH